MGSGLRPVFVASVRVSDWTHEHSVCGSRCAERDPNWQTLSLDQKPSREGEDGPQRQTESTSPSFVDCRRSRFSSHVAATYQSVTWSMAECREHSSVGADQSPSNRSTPTQDRGDVVRYGFTNSPRDTSHYSSQQRELRRG